MNLVHIIGYLGKDPEESCTPNGKKLWTLTVATRVRGRSKNEEETIWWRLTVWGDEQDRIIQHLGKGRPVYAVAELTRKFGTYADKNGQTQVSYEATVRSLHFVPVGNERNQEGGAAEQNAPMGQSAGGYSRQQAPQAPLSQAAQQPHAHSYANESNHESSYDDEPMPF